MSESRTALVVDDDDQLLRLMTRVLEREGIRVLSAGNGADARRLFREHSGEIDIALLDVLMPDGDGAASLLPDFIAERPEIDVVLTSGDDLPEALGNLIVQIGGGFLRKPFAPKNLLRMIAPESRQAAALVSSEIR